MLTRGDSGRPVRAMRAPAAGKGAALSRAAAATLFHEAVRKPFIEWSGLYA